MRRGLGWSGGERGGARQDLGQCESETTAASGSCQARYSCDRGQVLIDCAGDSAADGAPCECIVDDTLVATCITSDDAVSSDGARCGEDDNCCLAALGAQVD